MALPCGIELRFCPCCRDRIGILSHKCSRIGDNTGAARLQADNRRNTTMDISNIQMDPPMAERAHVVVTDYLAEAGAEKRVLDDVADVTLLQTNDEADLLEHASKADVLLVYHNIKLTEKSIAALARCKGIIRCGVGFDNVDVQAAGNRGIVVCNVPDYGTEEVADHALMLLLALARRLIPAVESIRAGRWECKVVFGTPRLRGKTLGIIGCGRIGSALALRAKAVGLRVLI